MPPSAQAPQPGTLKDLQRFSITGHLYAILDACDEPAVPGKVAELGPDKAVSLYRGRAEHEQWAVAPYLAHVDERFLGWIAQTLWTKPWGVFAIAECDLATLRKHFRRFLTVEDPEGEPMYFRYYDPRVLAVFLPTCTQEELRTFLGPLQAFAVSNPGREDISFFLRPN